MSLRDCWFDGAGRNWTLCLRNIAQIADVQGQQAGCGDYTTGQ
ncbi:hypothetical protein [Kosakonia oryziphila]|nr:hypothetical protein [Kosakonia oryziphila]